MHGLVCLPGSNSGGKFTHESALWRTETIQMAMDGDLKEGEEKESGAVGEEKGTEEGR